LAKESGISVLIYRDTERSQAMADITRTEVDLKKVYDTLLPQARGPADVSGISPATKPESPEWADHPVIDVLFASARKGVALDGLGAIVDFRPECRAATALVQAGIRHVVVRSRLPDAVDARWAQSLELDKAEVILKEDAGVALDFDGVNLPALCTRAPAYL